MTPMTPGYDPQNQARGYVPVPAPVYAVRGAYVPPPPPPPVMVCKTSANPRQGNPLRNRPSPTTTTVYQQGTAVILTPTNAPTYARAPHAVVIPTRDGGGVLESNVPLSRYVSRDPLVRDPRARDPYQDYRR